MCDKWAEKDSRIRVIHKENGGLSSARNAGLKIASGEFFGFIDSDDYILPEMYETLFRLVTENDADFSLCCFEEVDDNGKILPNNLDNAGTFIDEVNTGEKLLRKCLTVEWRYVLAWNKLYRSSVFKGISFPEGRIHEDEFTVHHFFCMAKKVAVTSKKMYIYVRRESSITGDKNRNANLKKMNDALDAFVDRYDFLRERGMNDLADLTMLYYLYIGSTYSFNKRISWCFGKCLRTGGIMSKLLLLKTFVALIRNIARNLYRRIVH